MRSKLDSEMQAEDQRLNHVASLLKLPTQSKEAAPGAGKDVAGGKEAAGRGGGEGKEGRSAKIAIARGTLLADGRREEGGKEELIRRELTGVGDERDAGRRGGGDLRRGERGGDRGAREDGRREDGRREEGRREEGGGHAQGMNSRLEEREREREREAARERGGEVKPVEVAKGGREKAEAEAAAFARLTAGARDPRKEAKERLAKKAHLASYERATKQEEMWRDLRSAMQHAESHATQQHSGQGIQDVVHRMATLPLDQAAAQLAKLSQAEGTAVLGALKGLEPARVNDILGALKDMEMKKKEEAGGGKKAKEGGEGKEELVTTRGGEEGGRELEGREGGREGGPRGDGGKEGGGGERESRSRGGESERSERGGKGEAEGGGGKEGEEGGKEGGKEGKKPPPPPHFNIMTVHRFQPRDSLSYVQERALETFSLSYADQSIITGYVGKDIVQIGQYYALTRFGCALDCNDPHFNGVDGILGLGMPDAALPQIPTPLLFAVSNDRGGIEGANYINEHPLRRRKFAFLSTAEGAELQLGGYDRASTNADMVYVPTTSTTEYSVNVQSLTFGGIELLDWVDKSRPNALPAIMDTGTTCLVIPDTLLGGRVSEKPFSKFKAIMTKGISFYITIDGHLFEIPYEFWWQKINQAPCVQPTPSSYAGLLLGDVVFQSLVVEFDLTKPSRPQVGVAPRNPLYSPVPPGVHDELKLPVIKKAGRHSPEVLEPDQERDDSHMVDHVPVAMSRLRTEYYVNISVGSPRQAFTVLIDTGSSTLAVFAKMPPEHSNLAISGSLEVKLHRAREELLHKDAAQRAVQRGQELELKERRAREAEERRERLEDLQGLGEGAGSAAAAFEISKSTSSRKEAMSLQFLRSGSGGTGASLYLMGSEEDRREEEGGAWGREWLLAGLGVALMVVGVGLAARRRLREGSKEPERTEMGMVT